MAIQEQAVLKMGLDVRDVEQAAQRASSAVQEVGEKGHKSILHAGNAARGFQRVLEQVGEQGGIVGKSLAAGLHGVAGLFAFIAGGAALVHEKLKEMNSEFDRVRDAGKKPLGDAKDRARETAKAVSELRLEQDKYARSLKTAEGDKILHTLKDSMTKVDDKAKTAIGAGADPVATERTRLQITYKMQEDALKAIAGEKMKATNDVETWERIQMNATKDQRLAKAKEGIEGERKMREVLEEELKTKLKQQGGIASSLGIFLGRHGSEAHAKQAEAFQEEIDSLQRNIESSKSRELADKKFIDTHELLSKAATDQLSEAKSRREKLRGQFEQMDEASAVTLRQLKAMPFIHGAAMAAPERNAALGVQAIQDRIDAATRRNQQSWTTWNRDHGMMTPETNMAGFSSRLGANEINRQLQEILNRMQSGVAVFGRE